MSVLKTHTWTKYWHFAQMQFRINWTFIFWAQNPQFVNLRLEGFRLTKKQTKHSTSKNKAHIAPKAHSLLPLLFLIMKKRCMHNEEGTCMEILLGPDNTTVVIVINYHHQFFFPTCKLRQGKLISWCSWCFLCQENYTISYTCVLFHSFSAQWIFNMILNFHYSKAI